MPIFDYVCNKCGSKFEVLVLNSNDKVQCPTCTSSSVKKLNVSLFSCTTVQLNKCLKMHSEEQHRRGMELAKKGTPRKKRMKII